MTICQFSIVRPVATIVFMLLLVVFGFICLNRMAVREYPDIDVPTISIDTTYDGASSNVVETKITQRIEDAVAGIEGLDTISSISRDGRSRITLEFKVERDIDAAANDVRDKVSRILKKLPDDADTPVVAKYDSSGSPVLILALTSNKMSRMELTDYADRYLVDRFSVIDGVASVSIFGAQEEAMRIWLNRQAMAARGVTAEDIISGGGTVYEIMERFNSIHGYPDFLGGSGITRAEYWLGDDDSSMLLMYIEEPKIWFIDENGELTAYRLDSDRGIAGDANGDGFFNISDVVAVQKWLLGREDISFPDWHSADVNSDGKVDIFDLCAMKRMLISDLF